MFFRERYTHQKNQPKTMKIAALVEIATSSIKLFMYDCIYKLAKMKKT